MWGFMPRELKTKKKKKQQTHNFLTECPPHVLRAAFSQLKVSKFLSNCKQGSSRSRFEAFYFIYFFFLFGQNPKNVVTRSYFGYQKQRLPRNTVGERQHFMVKDKLKGKEECYLNFSQKSLRVEMFLASSTQFKMLNQCIMHTIERIAELFCTQQRRRCMLSAHLRLTLCRIKSVLLEKYKKVT